MGLLTILRKQQLKDKQIRVLVLGLDNAGKTTLVKRALRQDVKDVSPTVGFSIQSIDQDGYTLNVWDVGGQKSLRPFWHNYFEKTDCLVWVVDASDLGRLADCRTELHKTLDEDRLQGAGLLIFVNKLDAIDPAEQGHVLERVTQALQLDGLGKHHYNVVGCSAYSGLNVDAGFDWVTNEVKSRLYVLD